MSIPEINKTDCIVIGAGISGLLAGRELERRGVEYLILDKGRGLGGRMATRRIGDSRFDHGAQFVTAKTPEFMELIDECIEAGAAVKWSDGVRTESGETMEPRPYYRGTDGMTRIAKYFADGLEYRLSTKITSLSVQNDIWTLVSESGSEFSSPSLIVTMPAPQALDLFDNSAVALEDDVMRRLRQIEYDPCIAAMITLDNPSTIPPPGALRLSAEPVSWISDNFAKGISPDGYGVTVHCGPEFSRDNYNTDDKRIAEMIIDNVSRLLGCTPLACRIHRWKYSRARKTLADRCLSATRPARIVFAGDGFGSGNIEAAALSGVEAAELVTS